MIAEIVNKMLSCLNENNPENYNWSYSLIVEGDTVILTPKEKIMNWETVKMKLPQHL